VGEAPAPQVDVAKPGPNEAVVYFFRSSRQFDRSYATLYANGKKIAEVRGDEFTRVSLTPGEFAFTSFLGSRRRRSEVQPETKLFLNKAQAKVELRGRVHGGEVYFLEWDQSSNHDFLTNTTTYQVSLERLPVDEAKRKIKICQWVEPTVERVAGPKY
jgi:hypothetical protein